MGSYILVLYFFSSPLQIVYLSLIFLVCFLFELILDYFRSKNLSLYQKPILAMLITDRHSFYFSQFWSTSVQLGLLVYFSKFSPIRSIRSNSVLFWSIRSTLVILVLFGPFRSIWFIQSTLVHLVKFSPCQSNLVYSVHFINFSLLVPIWSHLVHFSQFGLFQFTLVQFRVLKNRKR